MRTLFFAAASALALTACTSTMPAKSSTTPTETASTPRTPTEIVASQTPAQRAIDTARDLVKAGNEQAAIERLATQLGDPSNSREDHAALLLELGTIKLSDRGFDTWGAIADFREIREDYADTAAAEPAYDALNTANGKATSLNFEASAAETNRTRRMELTFELGEHQDAIDQMQASNLTPNNAILVAMYQIGYLCEGEALTGRVFSATDVDGGALSLQFCDLGK